MPRGYCYVILALWLDADKGLRTRDTLWPYYYYSWYPASLSDHQYRWHNTPHHFDTTQQPCEDVSITSIISNGAQFNKQNTYITALHYTSTWRLRTIIILNVVGLGLSYRMQLIHFQTILFSPSSWEAYIPFSTGLIL